MNELNKALYEKIKNNNNFVSLKVLSYNVSWENMSDESNKSSGHNCINKTCLNNVKLFIESNNFDIICL